MTKNKPKTKAKPIPLATEVKLLREELRRLRDDHASEIKALHVSSMIEQQLTSEAKHEASVLRDTNNRLSAELRTAGEQLAAERAARGKSVKWLSQLDKARQDMEANIHASFRSIAICTVRAADPLTDLIEPPPPEPPPTNPLKNT